MTRSAHARIGEFHHGNLEIVHQILYTFPQKLNIIDVALPIVSVLQNLKSACRVLVLIEMGRMLEGCTSWVNCRRLEHNDRE